MSRADDVKREDPEADDQLMREPPKHRLPRVARTAADEPVIEGAMGTLRAVQIRAVEVPVFARGPDPAVEVQQWRSHDVRHWPEVSIALVRNGIPTRIVKLYERGPDEPPRAIKVRRETDGKEIFMVWTSVTVKGARQFQWTSRGYQTRTGGMPTIVDLLEHTPAGSDGPDHREATAYVLRWVFTVGAPKIEEEVFNG